MVNFIFSLFDEKLLSTLIFLPCLFAVLVFSLPQSITRPLALIFSLLELLLSLLLFSVFSKTEAGLQLVERYSWVESFGVSYFVGIDGISFWLVLLSVLLVPLMILSSWNSISHKTKGFYASIFILETAMLGTFLAVDSLLFYIFFEASLIPMYFLIGIWGGPRRIYASLKFFIYTMAGSVLMLLAIITLIFLTQSLEGGVMSASLLDFYKLDIPFVSGEFFNIQNILFFAFCLAFAIKIPIFPFHTWLPDAHVEAPTAGSVVLAGVMLKMGAYGFLRFVIPLFPEATEYWVWLFFLLGLVGIIYGALVAMVQPDIKKLVAYSSVSHMGYIVIGLFTLNIYGITGSLYQMLNHGISTGALFLLVGIMYERTHCREISKYGGLAQSAPVFTVLFFIATLSSIAVPLTNGFIGEFLILMGAFQAEPIVGSFAVLGVILGAVYMLLMVQRVFFGEVSELVESHKGNLDVNRRELAFMAPLVILIFWMGIFPNHFLSWSKTSLDHFDQNKHKYYLDISTASTKTKNFRFVGTQFLEDEDEGF